MILSLSFAGVSCDNSVFSLKTLYRGTSCKAHLSVILKPLNILWHVAPRNDNVIMRGFGNIHDVKAVSISTLE
jgi:hypothetical protein